MTYSAVNIINSGSSGNAVIYYDTVLIDVGVSYKKLQHHLKNVKMILLTHKHKDHFQKKTIKLINKNFPHIYFGVPEHMLNLACEVISINKIIVLKLSEMHLFKDISIIPILAIHDVDNFGYKLQIGNTKIIHITDTKDICHIKAKDYDIYAIEHNYCEDKISSIINNDNSTDIEKMLGRNTENTHLSIQQAKKWLDKNNKNFGFVYELHKSKTRRD